MNQSGIHALAAAGLLLFVMPGTAARAADGGVGVVAEYRPAAGRFQFARAPGGQGVPVRIGTVVQAGDRVT